MRTFYFLLLNTLVANVTNSFLWFSLTFWAYLSTQSVISTSIIGGSFMILNSLSALFFGTFVDHHKKKTAMMVSSLATLVAYAFAATVFFASPYERLLMLDQPIFWIFAILVLIGAVAGGMRVIALATLVTILVEEKGRDKANGMVGTVNGIAFAITSVFSGLVIGLLGMDWALGISVVLTAITAVHLFVIGIPEKPHTHGADKDGHDKNIDLSGTILAIRSVPGLVGLIVFTTFNNLLGGAFMALMDAYGLSLVPVEVWGVLWGFLSFGFIAGGIGIAKWGLSSRPLRTLMLANIVMWVISIFFTIRSSIVLTAVGIFGYMCLIPVVEAVEQTIVQRVVPLKRQGRVFGFAHSIESAASPITAFIIGPLTQLVFIPFMNSVDGMNTFGWLLGPGPSRGIALVFALAGFIGLVVTILAMYSRPYRLLSASYAHTKK